MGSCAVGKTSIIDKYMHQKFTEEYNTAVDNLHDASEKNVRLEIMDSDGTLMSNKRRLAIRTAHAFLLVYAVDDEDSFDFISTLRNEIIDMKGDDVPIVVVGNKIDVNYRRVHPVMADCVVSIDWDCKYFEISVRERIDVAGIFNHLLSHPRFERQFGVSNKIIRQHSLPANALLKIPDNRKPFFSSLWGRVFDY